MNAVHIAKGLHIKKKPQTQNPKTLLISWVRST